MPKWTSGGCVIEASSRPADGIYECKRSRQRELRGWVECEPDREGVAVAHLAEVVDSQRVATDRSEPRFLRYRLVVRRQPLAEVAVQVHRFVFEDGEGEATPASRLIAYALPSMEAARAWAEKDFTSFHADPPPLEFQRAGAGREARGAHRPPLESGV